MIRFKKIGHQTRMFPVVVGPNNLTEDRQSFAIEVQSIDDKGDVITGNGSPMMPGMQGNGAYLIYVASEADMNRYANGSIISLPDTASTPTPAAPANAASAPTLTGATNVGPGTNEPRL